MFKKVIPTLFSAAIAVSCFSSVQALSLGTFKVEDFLLSNLATSKQPSVFHCSIGRDNKNVPIPGTTPVTAIKVLENLSGLGIYTVDQINGGFFFASPQFPISFLTPQGHISFVIGGSVAPVAFVCAAGTGGRPPIL